MIDWSLLGYPASLLMGLALGLTGGGGSILAVPILVYLFGIEALLATSYSLVLVGLVSLWGAFGSYQSGDLKLERAFAFGLPGVAGVFISRRFLLPLLPSQISLAGLNIQKSSILLIAFALLMLSAAISMIRSSRKPASNKLPSDSSGTSKLKFLLGGLCIGLIAGFVGAGGGFLIVPVLVNFGNLEMKQAVGTSLFVIALQSLIGTLGDLSLLSDLSLSLFVSIFLLAAFGMSIGSKLRTRLSPDKLKLGFGVFVLIMGGIILLQEITKGLI